MAQEKILGKQLNITTVADEIAADPAAVTSLASGINLDNLNDVSAGSPAVGQLLTYTNSPAGWIAQDAPPAGVENPMTANLYTAGFSLITTDTTGSISSNDISITTGNNAFEGSPRGGGGTPTGDVNIGTGNAYGSDNRVGSVNIRTGNTNQYDGSVYGYTVSSINLIGGNNSYSGFAYAGNINLTTGTGSNGSFSGSLHIDIPPNGTSTGPKATFFATGPTSSGAISMHGSYPSSSVQGGPITVYGGDSSGANGGLVNIHSGKSTAPTGSGGQIDIACGKGGTSGNGGALQLSAGAGGSTAGTGGIVSIKSGAGNNTSGITIAVGDTRDPAGNIGTLTLTGSRGVDAVGGGTGSSGGNIEILGGFVQAGAERATSVGGDITITGGKVGTGANGSGGNVNISGGAAKYGGSVSIYAGASPSIYPGSDIIIKAGKTTSGDAGSVNITGGDSGAGAGGSLIMAPGKGTGAGAQVAVQTKLNVAGAAELALWTHTDITHTTGNYVSLKSPTFVGSPTTNTTFTFPPDNGAAGDVLKTDGTGITSWGAGNILPTYTIATLPAVVEGAQIYVSDATTGVGSPLADTGVQCFGRGTGSPAIWVDVITGLAVV